MENKNKLLTKLEKERKDLIVKRELLLKKIEEEQAEDYDEYAVSIINDFSSELQVVVQQIFEIQNTIRSIKSKLKNSDGKLGELINIGDCVKLKSEYNMRQYFITHESNYINPQLGVISSSSPIAQQILNRKFGETIALSLNGMQLDYQLLP